MAAKTTNSASPVVGAGVQFHFETLPMALIKSKVPKIKELHEVGRYAVGVQWVDGHDSIFPLESLRRGCPCEACDGSVAGVIPPASQRVAQLSRLGDAAVFVGSGEGHGATFT